MGRGGLQRLVRRRLAIPASLEPPRWCTPGCANATPRDSWGTLGGGQRRDSTTYSPAKSESRTEVMDVDEAFNLRPVDQSKAKSANAAACSKMLDACPTRGKVPFVGVYGDAYHCTLSIFRTGVNFIRVGDLAGIKRPKPVPLALHHGAGRRLLRLKRRRNSMLPLGPFGRAYAPLFQGLRTTFSCVFEGFSRELSSNHIININYNCAVFANNLSKSCDCVIQKLGFDQKAGFPS